MDHMPVSIMLNVENLPTMTTDDNQVNHGGKIEWAKLSENDLLHYHDLTEKTIAATQRRSLSLKRRRTDPPASAARDFIPAQRRPLRPLHQFSSGFNTAWAIHQDYPSENFQRVTPSGQGFLTTQPPELTATQETNAAVAALLVAQGLSAGGAWSAQGSGGVEPAPASVEECFNDTFEEVGESVNSFSNGREEVGGTAGAQQRERASISEEHGPSPPPPPPHRRLFHEGISVEALWSQQESLFPPLDTSLQHQHEVSKDLFSTSTPVKAGVADTGAASAPAAGRGVCVGNLPTIPTLLRGDDYIPDFDDLLDSTGDYRHSNLPNLLTLSPIPASFPPPPAVFADVVVENGEEESIVFVDVYPGQASTPPLPPRVLLPPPSPIPLPRPPPSAVGVVVDAVDESVVFVDAYPGQASTPPPTTPPQPIPLPLPPPVGVVVDAGVESVVNHTPPPSSPPQPPVPLPLSPSVGVVVDAGVESVVNHTSPPSTPPPPTPPQPITDPVSPSNSPIPEAALARENVLLKIRCRQQARLIKREQRQKRIAETRYLLLASERRNLIRNSKTNKRRYRALNTQVQLIKQSVGTLIELQHTTTTSINNLVDALCRKTGTHSK
ncbi:uncharacterized protein LOC144462804 [Epinephelus lanceolatus]